MISNDFHYRVINDYYLVYHKSKDGHIATIIYYPYLEKWLINIFYNYEGEWKGAEEDLDIAKLKTELKILEIIKNLKSRKINE